MAKNSIDAYGASGKSNVLFFNPDALHLVDDATHPLYDERIHLPIDDAMVRNIADQGVLEPIIVWKDRETGKVCVVDGRQRVRHTREANLLLAAEGKPVLLVPGVVRQGSAIRMSQAMVSATKIACQRKAFWQPSTRSWVTLISPKNYALWSAQQTRIGQQLKRCVMTCITGNSAQKQQRKSATVGLPITNALSISTCPELSTAAMKGGVGLLRRTNSKLNWKQQRRNWQSWRSRSQPVNLLSSHWQSGITISNMVRRNTWNLNFRW